MHYCIQYTDHGTPNEAYYDDWRECQTEAERLSRRGIAFNLWQLDGGTWRLL